MKLTTAADAVNVLAAATTTAAPGTTAGPGTTAAATTSLKGICPDDVGIQTDWMPEAEHGFLYQMVGKGYTVDKGKAVVTGPLVDSKGNDTGVTVSIHSGGCGRAESAEAEWNGHPSRLAIWAAAVLLPTAIIMQTTWSAGMLMAVATAAGSNPIMGLVA